MKGVLVCLGELAGRTAAARIIDGVLDDLLIDAEPAAGFAPETILRARLGRPMKGMGGAFVDLPGGQTGFLRQTKGLAPGQSLLVQVSGPREDGKALPVMTRLLFRSRHAILTPDAPGLNISRQIRDEERRAVLDALAHAAMAGAADTLGLILRSACDAADDAEIADDIASVRALAEAVLADVAGVPEVLVDAPDAHERAWRDWADPMPDMVDDDPDAFDRQEVIDMVAALLRPEVALPGGGSMVIEPTRALVAVDINTGPDTSPAAGLKAAIAAARDLPRQLRLRGLGGQVVVDFAPVPKKDRHIVEQALKAAFRRDGAETVLAGWTPLGNFEIQRRRDRLPLSLPGLE